MRPFFRRFLNALPMGVLIGLASALVWVLYDVVISKASWGGAVADAVAAPFSWISFALIYALLVAFVRPEESAR